MAAPTPLRKRPPNRRDQIAATAAEHFRDLGYHRVGVHDLAASVGITGRAIYRHFATKEDLLDHVVTDGLGGFETAVGAATTLDGALRAMVAWSLDRRDVGVLIQREARHLPPERRADIATRATALVAALADLVQRERPSLTPEAAALIARAAIAVITSPSHHTVPLTRPEADELLIAMAGAVLTADLPPATADTPARDGTAPARASRREAVLAAAIDLFGRSGYAAVRMEDVGAAAGIAGPSIYEHFASKSDLLMAALTRGAEWLQLGLSRALATAAAPDAVLAAVVESYVDFAVHHRELMRVLLTEAIYLPDEERHALRRLQHEYVSEWAHLVAVARADDDSTAARVRTHGALAIVNDRLEGGDLDSGTVDAVTALGMEVLVG